jgi:hypothetical protein
MRDCKWGILLANYFAVTGLNVDLNGISLRNDKRTHDPTLYCNLSQAAKHSCPIHGSTIPQRKRIFFKTKVQN